MLNFGKLALQLDDLYLRCFDPQMCRFWLSILLIGGFLGCGESDQNSSNLEGILQLQKKLKIPPQTATAKIEKTRPLKPEGTHQVEFVGIEMIWVPAGSFQMGSPFDCPVRIMDEKPHQVELAEAFTWASMRLPNTSMRWSWKIMCKI